MSSSNLVWKNSKYIYSAYFRDIRQYFPHIFARQPNSPARLKYQSTVDDSHSLQQTVIVTGVRNGPVGQHSRLSVPVDLLRRQGSRTGALVDIQPGTLLISEPAILRVTLINGDLSSGASKDVNRQFSRLVPDIYFDFVFTLQVKECDVKVLKKE